MGLEIDLILGQIFTQFALLDEKPPDVLCGPGGD